MSAWDEQPEHANEIADLETARLALRGAIQSVRSLQDLNGKLKGEVQDFLHREKALNERLIRLQTELNESYARLDQEMAHDREREAAVRETLRQEIIAEQNHKWQSEIDGLRQSVQNWTEVRRQKETELKMLKETLLSKEQEVFILQKEKITAEENAHREILETIKRSREGVAASVEQAIRTKEKEISDLQRKLAAQPKIIEERMQQIEQDLHRKEQSLLLQFRDRQQSLELDWAHREKELWEKATEARETLEHELKSQWESRRKTLEETLEKRRTTLEIQAQQHHEEHQRRALSRDEELHKTWAAKEASLAQEWASREKEMARQFQATLDQERLRASEQAAQLKAETDLWRKTHEETLRQKENDFNRAHVENEQKLRTAYRKKEEDLLARHQEALEIAQHQISELMVRTSEKEGLSKSAQERLANAVKERDAMADRLARLESDATRRNAELEQAIKTRDEELARLNQTFTTQQEGRVSQIQLLERDQLHKDSELKVLREKILQTEADRQTALEHAATLENQFTLRQQQLEESFRKETETLGERLAASSKESAERQQTDQRCIAELTAESQQRTAEIQGLTHQLQLARHDIEKLTQDSADKQTKSLLIRRQLEERLVQREAELHQQIETLDKERMLIEERLDARVAELEQELSRRLSEDRALQERFEQSEAFRVDLEAQAEVLRDRFMAHERQSRIREDETRAAQEAAEKERITAEQKLLLRIGELETTLTKQEGISAGLQDQLARSQADRQEELKAAHMRETRLEGRARTLEQQLKTQADEIHARLASVQSEHERIEMALRQQLQEQDAAHMKAREEILDQVAALEGELRRRELEVKTLKDQIAQEGRTQLEKTREQVQREAALEERVQFLYQSLEIQKTEHQAQVEQADHSYRKEQNALRAQVLQLETELGRKTVEANDLLARLAQAQILQQEMQETVALMEARAIEREQALRAAAQTHLESEQKLEIAVTELKAAVQKRDADVLAAEKALQTAQREQQAEASAAAQREKQWEERVQNLDEKLRTQKDQITMRLSSVERQRLQNEETLHTRTLDLEQRLAEKSGLVKNLQDQLGRAVADHEHLEKKIASLEAHLARADGQLKSRETEFQSVKSISQKELAATQESHQRKLLELQGQRLTLEAELKGLQETLHQTEEEKKRLADQRSSLEERLRTDTQAHQAALDSLMKQRMALEESHQAQLLSTEEALAAKTNALQSLEHRLTTTEEQRADRDNLVGILQKEIHDLQLSFAAQQEEFRSRISGFEKERTQLQEAQQNRITHLESQLQYRESAVRSLEEKISMTKSDHESVLEAASEREALLTEKAKALEATLTAQTKEWQGRMEGLLAERLKSETDLHSRVVTLQENLSVREQELAVLKETLKQTEQTQKAFSSSSQEAMALSAKERQTLEERVLRETGRVRDLESQLRGHSVHIKEMEKSLTAGVAEREFLQASLNELTQRMDAETVLRERAYVDKTRSLEHKMETLEHEWRERLEESSKASLVRVDSLQGKVVELECALGVRENDLSALHQEMAELSNERERLNDLVIQKDRERQTILEVAARDKEEFAAQVGAVQAQRKVAEETLNSQLKQIRESLEQKLLGERQRSQGLDTQLAAQMSELRQLRASLIEAKEERERLLSALAGERQKTSLELKARDQSSLVLEADLRQQMRAQQEEFKAKLATAEKETTLHLTSLQARAAELEKDLTLQRANAEERAALLEAENAQSLEALQVRLVQEHAQREKLLHDRMLDLRGALGARVAEVEALSLRLRETEQERSALDQYSTTSHTEATRRREELEAQLAQERDQKQNLETQCTTQISELKQLQSALADVRAERETLLVTLAAERAKAAQEFKGRQKAATEIEAALRTHFETQLREGRARFEELQKRALELEQIGGEKQATIDKLKALLKDSEQAKTLLEHSTSELKADATGRYAELEKQTLAERQRAHALETQLSIQVSELQTLRSALEETKAEREAVLQTLAKERGDMAAALTAEKNEAATRENEFRERLAGVSAEASARLAITQKRLLELEKIASDKQASLERLSEAVSQAESQRSQAEKQWAIEIESRRGAEALAARQKADFEARVAALQKDYKSSESSLQARLLELRDTLAVRAAENERLGLQLKETEQARAALEYYSTASHADGTQKRAALEEELRSERVRVQALDLQLVTHQSELKQLTATLEETKAERDQLIQVLEAERQKSLEDLKLQKNASHGSEALLRSQSKAKEEELLERLATLESESRKRMAELLKRTMELEKSAAVQRSELEQRNAFLQAEKTKSDKQMQLQISELQTQLTLKQADLEAIQNHLSAALKEKKALEALVGESKKAAAERHKEIQQRVLVLEQSEAEKIATLERLRETVAQLETSRAQVQKECATESELRHAAEALAAQQKKKFEAQLSELAEERQVSESALHQRLLELREELSARVSEVQKLTVQLKETEQARASLEEYSTASHADHNQKREALESDLHAERARVQALDTQLTTQRSELKELRTALAEAIAEREQLLKTLAVDRQKATEALKLAKNATLASELTLRDQNEAIEKEFRERLAAVNQESEKRLAELQLRAAGLEMSAAAQRSELEQRIALLQAEKTKSDRLLQAQLSDWQTQFTLKQAELEAVQTQLAAVQKELQAFEAAAGEDKKTSSERAKAMQQRMAGLEKSESEKHIALERMRETVTQLEAKCAHTQKQWNAEAELRHAAESLAEQQKKEFEAQVAGLAAERQLSESNLLQRLLELRETLSARVLDIQKLEVQLRETEQARASLDEYSTASHAEQVQKREALESELHAERARVQALDTQLTAQQSELKELHTALNEAIAEREQLLKTLALDRQKSTEALKLQKNAALTSELALRHQNEEKEKEFRERLAAVDRESEKRLSELQARAAGLEKSAAIQRSELEQRVALLQAEKTKSDQILQAQLSDWQTQFTLKQAELESVQTQLAAVQKDLRAFEAAAGEDKKTSSERLKVMQQRVAVLEKSESEKHIALERLRETVAQLEAKCAHTQKQWAEEIKERQTVQELALRQKEEFEARLLALASERKAGESALHGQLLELRHTLTGRATDIQKLELQLKETEQARAALAHHSTVAHEEAEQRRTSLEEQLASASKCSQALATQLTIQVSELKQLQEAFENAREEREGLFAALSEAREKAAADLKNQKILTTERETTVRAQMEAQEKEFRLRLAAADAEMERRVATLQARTAELEKTLATQRADFEERFALAHAERAKAEMGLQTKISELHALWVTSGTELTAVEEQLTTVTKERDTLASLANGQKTMYSQQLDALRQQVRDLQRVSNEKQTAMDRIQEAMKELEAHRAHAQEQWEIEAQERRQAQDAAVKAEQEFIQKLASLEADHRATEEGLHQRLLDLRSELDLRLNAERNKNQTISIQLANQVSELKQLRASLEETRQEREKLVTAVAAEREKAAAELKNRETLTTEQKLKYEQRLAAQEKQFHERLESMDADATRRFNALQARTLELEKTLATQHSDYERQMAAQRSDYEQRLAVIQAERSKTEKTLQGTLSDLQGQLALRTKAIEALQGRLELMQSQREQWELSLSTLETDQTQERKEFESRLSEARARAAAAELELKTQTAAYHELQDALAAARRDGIALTQMVDDQHKKMQSELGLRETATAELKKSYEARLAALEKDLTERLKTATQEATARMTALQARAVELEQEIADKQALVDRLRESLTDLEGKRGHLEEQHLRDVQERQDLKKEMSQERKTFETQYAELRSALEQRARDVEQLEKKLEETQLARASLETQAALSHSDLEKEKQTLTLRWAEEKARVADLDKLIKSNIAQIKDLKGALLAEQALREHSVSRNDEYEQRIEEWRRRTTDLEDQGAKKQTALNRLNDALVQAEAKGALAERQKEELALHLEAIQTERKVAEEQLHERLNGLRVELEHRIYEEISRSRNLDAKVHAQSSELKDLRQALSEETGERERLTKALAAERERALLELKGREKASTESTSQLWAQMEAQEKEFRFQLMTLEEESTRRIGLLQARAMELEKALAAQRSEFELRLSVLQRERSETEEKLHIKIINLEETLNRRIAEAQQLHAEFAAVESARAIAETSATSAHSEMVRQQKSFDERLALESAQARALEQELQQYKSKARVWKETLSAVKESDEKQLALRNQLDTFERELTQRDRVAEDLRKNLASLEEERNRLASAIQEEEEEKKVALERVASLEARLEKTRHEDLRTEQKMHAQLVDLQDQLERKGAALALLEDRLEQLQKSNEDLSKVLNRDSTSWTRQKQELEEKLIAERSRLRELETEQVSQGAALRDLQETLAAAEKERQQALDSLKAQKERFLSDLAQRDSGTAQRHRALELEREALDKAWQERLKVASHETLERMETLKRRADDLEKQLAFRQAELSQRHDQVTTLEADRRTLSEQIDSLNRDRRDEANAAAAERARLLERSRALEERLKEQTRELALQLDSVEETREKTKEALEHRLIQLQDQLAKRTIELKNAQERLRMVEESRTQAEKEAGQGQSQLTRERAQLEERLAAERARTKELTNRLNDVASKLQEAKEAVAATQDAQQAQRQQLAVLRESEKMLQQRIHSLEQEVRASSLVKHESAEQELGTASEKTLALERELAARDAEIQRLKTQAGDIKLSLEQQHAAEIEKRVAERLRDQMMNVLETGKLKNGDAGAMQTLLEEWVFGFAHQVRNPLGIIRSVAESLLEAARRQSERDSLGAILKAVDGLNLRLREFIEFSKPVKPLLQVVDVPSAVTAAIDFITDKSLPKNIAIETSLPAVGTRLWMDPDHMRTILVQLLRNAVESMPKGGHVRVGVSYESSRQQLGIRVQDEGTGISNGHMKEVGRPFFSTKPGAVGLGLALTKRLLRAYDGKLDIESRPGHSTTVICRLKAKQEEAGQWAA